MENLKNKIMNNELRKIVEQRLKNAKTNALAVGTETPTGKIFTGKAELLDSILQEYVTLTIPVVASSNKKEEKDLRSSEQRQKDMNERFGGH